MTRTGYGLLHWLHIHRKDTTMTTHLFYPDISGHQAPPEQKTPLSLTGAHAVCVKATEGTTYTNPWYAHWKAEAETKGVFFFAYHMLHHGNAAAQAQHCYSIVGAKTGVMLDVEPTPGSNPTIDDEVEFVDAYRKLGGIIWLDYLPHWYWQQLGSLDGTRLKNRGLLLVSSDYTTYSDTGPGWAPYAGRTPTVWQYSSSQLFNGQHVDFNAFKGTVSELKSLVLTGKKATDPQPFPSGRHVVSDNPGTLAALAKLQGCDVADIWWTTAWYMHAASLELSQPGDLQRAYLNKGDWNARMPSGMVLYLP